MRRIAALPLAVALGACASAPLEVPVREVAGSAQCHTPAGTAPYTVLKDADGVRTWQSERSLSILAADKVRDVPHVAIEMGHRPTGGYHVMVAPTAVLRDGTLLVTAGFSGPEPGAMVSQALTSPCALVELPDGDYERIEVRNHSGSNLKGSPTKSAVPES